MKKIVALLMVLAMMLSCTAFAEPTLIEFGDDNTLVYAREIAYEVAEDGKDALGNTADEANTFNGAAQCLRPIGLAHLTSWAGEWVLAAAYISEDGIEEFEFEDVEPGYYAVPENAVFLTLEPAFDASANDPSGPLVDVANYFHAHCYDLNGTITLPEDIDEDGFVYATNIDETGEQGVRRLNPRGEDVIKKGRNEHVGGDLWSGGTGAYAGPSQITDVVYRGHGIYSLLDRKRGRIFTYDHEGNLLYIFGGLGTQAGTFNTPTAIEQWNNQLLVLDATRNEIYCFAPTEYGSLINEAVALRHDGDEALAVELWRRVLELDENNELANTGIGKAYLSAGDNEMAMKYLKLGMNRDYYSVAFKRYRSELLRRYLGQVLTGAVVITVGIWVFLKIRERKEYSREGGSRK